MADAGALRPVREAAGDLPVLDVLDEAVEAVATTRRCVLEAPAGAGKTTVLPLALAEDDRVDGRVVVLEPRRVAARAAARRMASLVGDRLGGHVGVTTRDDRRTSAATRVEVVTEGVLVNRLQRDPTLAGTAVVVLDEFHERSLEADLALALSLDVATLREDLGVVVTSATLEGDRVARLLGGAPVVRSDGRLHAVTVEHREVSRADDLTSAVVGAVLDALATHEGDVLVFLPGLREIRDAARALGGRVADGVRLLPLHGGLPAAEQDAALRPAAAGARHVVLATDLAESSLTVPGVRVVVDSGLAREPWFDPDSGLSRLVTTRISRDRAAQRAGRAGRVAPGIAVRLWPRRSHGGLEPSRTPAVAREDLAGFALEVARWGVRDPGQLALLDQPPPRSWAAATDLLVALGAVDDDGVITDHGAALASLPLPPRLAHMVVAASPGDRELACELAALLVDRDLLRGRGTVDLAGRVLALRGRGAPSGMVVDDATRHRVRRDVERLRRLTGAGRGDDGPTVLVDGDAGRLLCRAYPDRVAQRRGEGQGRYLLANGRGALLDRADPLATEQLLVVADLDAGAVDARAFLAAALHPEDLDEVLGHAVLEVEHVAWDERRGDVVAERRRTLGALVLQRGPLEEPDDAATTAALLEGIRSRGLVLLPWDRTTTSLRARAAFLHGAIGEPWPPVDDDALLGDLEQWLAPYLVGISRVGQLRRVPLADALGERIGWGRVRDVDRLAPRRLPIPSGREVEVRYDPDAGPVLAAKLQEFFGGEETPTVAGGRVPVTIELLTPAGRPAAVTSDLPGFWSGAYADVRAELRGRYTKHPWPEDPTTARPTARTTRRS